MVKRAMFACLVLSLSALPATGHETSLSLSRTQVQPGDLIEVRGAGLEANAAIKLTLEGVLTTYPLGEAQGNAHGEFRVELVIPAEVKPGNYTVEAQAGSTTASAPLKVVRRGAAMAEEQQEVAPLRKGPDHQETGPEGRAKEHASAEPLQLDRSWRRSETVTVWGLIVLAVLLAGRLFFKS